jgi:hypothetical protein
MIDDELPYLPFGRNAFHSKSVSLNRRDDFPHTGKQLFRPSGGSVAH